MVPFVALESLNSGANQLTQLQQAKKNKPRVPQGRPSSVKGGTPSPEVPNNRSQKQNAAQRETITQMAPKLEPQSESLIVFWGIFFDALFASCVRCCLSCCFDHFGISLSSFLCSFGFVRNSCWNQLIRANVHGSHTGACFLRFQNLTFV